MVDYFDFIKADTRSWFSRDCMFCFRQKECISASALTTDKRKHLLNIRGFREAQTPSMLVGIERHKEMEAGVPTLDEYGINAFKKDLKSGRMVVLSEVKCHSRLFGYRGVIDMLGMRFDRARNAMDVWIVELKSSFRKSHMFQLACYARMASDSGFSIFCSDGELKPYPNAPITMNIHLGMWIERFGKSLKWEYMEDGDIVGGWRGYTMALARRAKSLRSVHRMGVYDVSELPRCRECYGSCGFYRRICSKIPDTIEGKRARQLYFGRKKMLVKKR